MPGCRLTLLVPGLFGPEADPDARGGRAEQDREAGVLCADLDLPNFSHALSRAREAPPEAAGASLEALYFSAFGLSVAADEDPPAAALTAAIDGLDPGGEFWLRADPVHLRPDPGRLILRDSRDLNIQLDEARQLAADLNSEMEEPALEFIVAHPERWYLRLDSRPRFTSCSPAEAHGRDADSCLVRGADARYWHRVQNQIQMLLHQSSVNRAREAGGRPAINSLWLWGAGHLPRPPERRWERVCGDDPLIEALARYSGSTYSETLEQAGAWLATATGNCLMITRRAARAVHDHDRDTWGETLEFIEEGWLGPSLEALRNKKLDLLTVDGGTGRSFVLTAWDRRKWWRRDQSLQTLFSTARAPLT